jgi:hypothetical protein
MERESFVSFVSKVIQDVILLAEEQTGKRLPNRMAFQWLGKNHPRIYARYSGIHRAARLRRFGAHLSMRGYWSR